MDGAIFRADKAVRERWERMVAARLDDGDGGQLGGVMLLGYFSFLLPFIPVLLLHRSHTCIAPRPLGLASSLLGSLYFYFLGVDSL